MEKVIIFEENAKKAILDLFDKTVDTVDNEEFVVEKDDPSQKVLTPDGEEMEFKEFGGIRKGSEIFIKSDLISLISLSDRLK